MARLTGPDESVRLVYVTSGTNKGKASGQGMSAVLYADEALTTLADVQTTLGADIEESTVIVDAYSKLPLILFPDDVDTIWTSINGGPAVALYARTDDRLDALAARATALEAGGAGDTLLVHKAGAETITDVKTFSSSPLVPTPTTASQAATKGYVDGLVDDLSGVTDASTARANLSLGNSATRAVGTANGTVAAGDDSRFPATTITTVAAAGAATTLADAADGMLYVVTLTAATCAITFPTATAGKSFTLLLKQNTASRLATWPGTVKWPMDTPPTLSTTISYVDEISFRYDGAVWRGCHVAAYSA